MNIFYDTEFIDDGKTIDLISIGMVREDGKELYLQNRSCDFTRSSDWLKKNVLPELLAFDRELLRPRQSTDLDRTNPWVSYEDIGNLVLWFLGDEKPALWGWYSAYDHVALCQLFGPMADCPKEIPHYTQDVKQWCLALGNPTLPRQTQGNHNALADAKHIHVMWEFLRTFEEVRNTNRSY